MKPDASKLNSTAPIKIISTDFDGTLFAEFENPPIPPSVTSLIQHLQSRGAKWVINTGRDMSSLMEALARSHIPIQPDYLVLVEREIFAHDGAQYVGLTDWNAACARQHADLFAQVRPHVPALVEWVNRQYRATVYEDAFSPFCLIAQNNGDADEIHAHLDQFCARIPNLTVVRNDVYARFSHADFNKGTALTELGRRLGVGPEHIFAAGDWLNDLPMLDHTRAHCLTAPANAIEPVKAIVRQQGGYVSALNRGEGIADGLSYWLRQLEA